MKWFIFSILVVVFCTLNVNAQVINDFTRHHPRVYLKEESVSIIKGKIKSGGKYKELWDEVKTIDHPFAYALEALITGNKELSARAAIDFLPMLSACQNGRVPYNEMQIGACIYDWCYKEMGDELKQKYIKEFKRIADSHSPYYPAKARYNSLIGHNTEGWLLSDQLTAGLAIYDEDTEMFDSASYVFFKEFIPARNFIYKANMHHQGDSYAAVRLLHDLFATWMFRVIGVEIFDSNQGKVPYQYVYNYRPDGQQMRSGDTFDDEGNDSGGKSKLVMHKGLVLRLAAALYGDSYLVNMYQNYFPVNEFEKIFELMLLPYETSAKSIDELPLTKYFPQPMSEMVARTGWDMGLDSKTAVIQMRIGNYFFGNHQSKDFGTFQIYYKGPLAISSGLYEGIDNQYGSDHWKNYLHQTISKNGLLIFDPDEKIYKGSVNDGGQRWPNEGIFANKLNMLLDKNNGYEMGRVKAHGFGPDKKNPVYSYISGAINNAYDSSKVSKVNRSMLAFNTNESKFPALFLVFDRVESKKSSLQKTWLIHSIEEPTINGNRFTIIRTGEEYRGKGKYNGKLTVRTILPEDPLIVKIGGKGKEYWLDASQTNYFTRKENPASEGGSWRIEVSPSKNHKLDYFFNVMVVSDANDPKEPDIDRFQTAGFVGAIVQGYVSLFNKGNDLAGHLKFYLLQDANGVFIEGLKDGSWKIIKNGKALINLPIDVKDNFLFIGKIGAGKYELKEIK